MDTSITIFFPLKRGEIKFQTYENADWLSTIDLGLWVNLSLRKDPIVLQNLRDLRDCIDQAIEFQQEG